MTRRRIALAAVVATVVAFLVITSVTGLDGPGPLRRYPTSDLTALGDEIEREAGDIRTPDDCWRTVHGNTGPVREIARVDHLRSRLVVRLYASQSGDIDSFTFNAATDRIDSIVQADDRFSWAMIQLEPSPDGWSPLVSCPRVTRGWITGF